MITIMYIALKIHKNTRALMIVGKNFESRYEFEFWKEVFAKFKLQKERRIWDNALIKYEFGDDFTGNDVVDEVEITQSRLKIMPWVMIVLYESYLPENLPFYSQQLRGYFVSNMTDTKRLTCFTSKFG